MEQNQDSSLFGLSIDPGSKSHLAEAARWAKFLAIVGFVVCILIVLIGVFFGSVFSNLNGRYGRYGSSELEISSTAATVAAVGYVLAAVLYFFPCLFLYRFATRMKSALLANDQNTLNSSFQNLKKTFRYVGVLTIIILAFYALALVIGLAGAATTR